MELILLKNIDKVGDKHEVVKVKNGYGRNYLIPQGLAIVANTVNRKHTAEMSRQTEAKESKMMNEFKAMAERFDTATLVIKSKAGASGRLFGSVSNVQVASAIREQLGIDIERRKVVLVDDVKDLGSHTATINLHKEVTATLKFDVVPTEA